MRLVACFVEGFETPADGRKNDGAIVAEDLGDMGSIGVETSGYSEVAVGKVDPADQERRTHQDLEVEKEAGSIERAETSLIESYQPNQVWRESTSTVIGGSSDRGLNRVSTPNFRAEDDSSTDLFEGSENGDGVSSGNDTEGDPEKNREDFGVTSGGLKQEDVVGQSRKSAAAPNTDLFGHVEGTDAHTDSYPVEENSPGVEAQYGKAQSMEEFESKVESDDEGREKFIAEVEELKAQAGRMADEREKLLSTAETSKKEADRLSSELIRCLEMSKNEVEEKSKLAAQLQSALEELQESAARESQYASELKGIQEERDKEISARNAETSHLQQQLQDMANEGTRLANQILKQLHGEKASYRVTGEVDDNVRWTERREADILQELGKLKKHAETLERATKESDSVVEDLEQELQRLEEENKMLRKSSDNSSLSEQKLLADNLCLTDDVLELRVGHSSLASLRHEKDEEIRKLSNQIWELERQLHELGEDHANVVLTSKCLELSLEDLGGEKVQLKSLVDSILEDRQKREEEVAGQLEIWEEQVHTMEAEKLKLLSCVEELNVSVRKLEEEKSLLASRFDELSQTLQGALGEKARLASTVYKLEQKTQSEEEKVSDMSSELRITQEQLLASREREQVLISDLQQNKAERDEENVNHVTKVQELHLQLQGLREENAHVVIKASKLDQLVEELESKKVRLVSELDLLAQERQRREEKIEAELGIWREHVQSLETEKLASVALIDSLSSQVQRLEEDNSKLMVLSDESNQSLKQLWEEYTRLIEEVHRLEQEKQAQEGEKLELVAGLQTIWEQLQQANGREAVLASELKGLRERRDVEEATTVKKVKDLEQQLQAISEEKAVLSSKSLETAQMLEELRQETSQMLKELVEEKAQLVIQVAELVKTKQETEEEIAREQNTWKVQAQCLESDKAASLSVIEVLKQQIQKSGEEIKDLAEKDVKSNQLIQELRGANLRLGVEIDKLEEVKERQEGERLELAAELQAAWDQIQAVRESEADLTTELSELKEQRDEEKLRVEGQVQGLRQQLQELGEQKLQFGTKINALTKRLNELGKEQDLQDENARLADELAMLEQEKEKMALERADLFEETQILKVRVQSLEVDKNRLASEIDELNQWLQRPAAEKRQLATKLDEMTHLVKDLEVERSQLTTTVSKLEEEWERRQEEIEKLTDLVKTLEEQKMSLVSTHEESLRQLQSLEEEKMEVVKVHEESSLSVQMLNEQVHCLEEKMKSMVSLHEDLLLRLQSLEEEKTQFKELLEEQTARLKGLQLENSQHINDASKIEGELVKWHSEVQLVNDQVSSLEEEKTSMTAAHQESICQLHVLEEEKREGVKLLEESTLCVRTLSEQLHSLEEEKQKLLVLQQEFQNQVQSLEQEKDQLEESLKEQAAVVKGLRFENSRHINNADKFEVEVAKLQAEIQLLNDHVSRLEEGKRSMTMAHQDSLCQLRGLEEDKRQGVELLRKSTLLVQTLNEQLHSLEEEKQKLVVLHQDLHIQVQSLDHSYEMLLLQFKLLEEEKIELAKSLEDSNLLTQALQVDNSQPVSSAGKLEDELVRVQAEVQRFEEEKTSLLTVHQESLLQLQALEVENENVAKHVEESKVLAQKWHTDNSQLVCAVRNFEQEVEKMWEEIQTLSILVHILEDENNRGLSEHNILLLQFRSVEEEKAEMAESLEESSSLVQRLKLENSDYASIVSRLEEDRTRSDKETETLNAQLLWWEEEKRKLVYVQGNLLVELQSLEEEKVQFAKLLEESGLLVQRLEVEKSQHGISVSKLDQQIQKRQEEIQSLRDHLQSVEDRKSSEQHEYALQLQSMEEEKSQLASALEESKVLVKDLEMEVGTFMSGVRDFEEEKEKLETDLKVFQNQILDTSTERDLLQSELYDSREQLQEYETKLEESESDARKSTEEVFELVKQLETYQEQVVRLVEEKSKHIRQLMKLKHQMDCISKAKNNLVKKLEMDLKQLLRQVEGEKSHLAVGIHGSRKELRLVIWNWIEMVTDLCQELDELSGTLGGENEEGACEQRLSSEEAKIVRILCQELDGLLRQMGEEKERVVEELTMLKDEMLQPIDNKTSLEKKVDFNGDKCQRCATDPVADKELLLYVERQKLQAFFEEKMKLEEVVARLSSSLEESQKQLQAFITKGSIENPQLHAQVQAWKEVQHFEQDDDRHDETLPGNSVDDKYLTNYAKEFGAMANGKALNDARDQGLESPAWSKEYGTVTSMDLFSQVQAAEMVRMLQQEIDTPVHVEGASFAELEPIRVHSSKDEKGKADLIMLVKQLEVVDSVLEHAKLVSIDQLDRATEESNIKSTRSSNVTLELHVKTADLKETSDLKVKITKCEGERDAKVVAAHEADSEHCDIGQKAHEELEGLRIGPTKLSQEYKTGIVCVDNDSRQLDVSSKEGAQLLLRVRLLEEENLGPVKETDVLGNKLAQVNFDFEALKVESDMKSVDARSALEKQRDSGLEKKVESITIKLESAISEVFSTKLEIPPVTVSSSCEVLEFLHQHLVEETASARRHLQQVQAELLQHRDQSRKFQENLKARVMKLFSDTVVDRPSNSSRTFELCDSLVSVLLTEGLKVSEKLHGLQSQLAEAQSRIDYLVENAGVAEEDRNSNLDFYKGLLQDTKRFLADKALIMEEISELRKYTYLLLLRDDEARDSREKVESRFSYLESQDQQTGSCLEENQVLIKELGGVRVERDLLRERSAAMEAELSWLRGNQKELPVCEDQEELEKKLNEDTLISKCQDQQTQFFTTEDEKLSDTLGVLKEEIIASCFELAQSEDNSWNAREKSPLATSKGMFGVQHSDGLKLLLAEKTGNEDEGLGQLPTFIKCTRQVSSTKHLRLAQLVKPKKNLTAICLL